MASAALVITPVRSRQESAMRTRSPPSLARMAREGRIDAQAHSRRSKEALEYWLRQSERLSIARTEHGLRGDEYVEFGRSIGLDRSTAFALIKLHPHRDELLARCAAEADQAERRGDVYYYPGWRTALRWFASGSAGGGGSWFAQRVKGRQPEGDDAHPRYWLTPPALYARLHREFRFDLDPCPYPLPPGWDALSMAWGKRNYVNPPYSLNDGPGLTAFVRKAIAERDRGRTSVLVSPVSPMVDRLIAAGAEVRSLGRVPFLDVETRAPTPNPLNCCAFILRGHAG